MVSSLRLVAIVAVCVSGASIGLAEEPKEKPKIQVELRWVERTFVEGLTEKQGIQASCAPDHLVYPHMKPALLLARQDVGEARLQHFDWEMSKQLQTYYSVTLVLTKDARDRLAAACPGAQAQLAVAVDGHYWGIAHYVKDKNADVSDLSRAEKFNPYVGYFSSKAEAEHLANAFK